MPDHQSFGINVKLIPKVLPVASTEEAQINARGNGRDGDGDSALLQQCFDTFTGGNHVSAQVAVFRCHLNRDSLHRFRIQRHIVSVFFVHRMVRKHQRHFSFIGCAQRGIAQQKRVMAVDDVWRMFIDKIRHDPWLR